VVELVEIEERTSEADSDGPPVAHIAPVALDGKRHALCGAEILGINVGSADYTLCPTCDRLSRFDYHDPSWDGKF
jgi:hypothetical protein